MGRLRSLDVFRGITVAAMVIVNNPGDWAKYGQEIKRLGEILERMRSPR